MQNLKSSIVNALFILPSITALASQGCRYEWTPIECNAETAGLSTQELESFAHYESFNLVGDCVGQEHLECREVLPDTCDVACAIAIHASKTVFERARATTPGSFSCFPRLQSLLCAGLFYRQCHPWEGGIFDNRRTPQAFSCTHQA